MIQDIYIKGAKEHNLNGIDVSIPRNKLTVVTGLSGSGKSSLAFDTLYAEGQRRYVESLSAYARQFLDRMQKPDVEHIEGLSPAIAIEQRSTSSNPRSTVATTTEIYDYLRLLYAHTGIPHCPQCGDALKSQSAQSISDKIASLPEGRRMMLLAPYIQGKKGEHSEVFERIRKDGFLRARVDGQVLDLEAKLKPLAKTKRHTIEAVVDRLTTGRTDSARLMDSVELCLKFGEGSLVLLVQNEEDAWEEEMISEHLACVKCGISMGELQPRNFSFNSPYGACSECNGLGSLLVMDPELVVPDPSLPMRRGAIPAWRRGPRRLIIYYNHLLRRISEHYDIPDMLSIPFEDLPEHVQKVLLYGSGEEVINFDFWRRGKTLKIRKPFEGILANLQRRYHETESDSVRTRLKECMSRRICPSCEGARLNPASLAVTVGDISIHEFNQMSITVAKKFMENLTLDTERQAIAKDILKEIIARLSFLDDVGLSYLSLSRESGTLSGGEAQRIRLATQLGCGLVGVLYILDEPSIGLHQRDHNRLLDTLTRLRDIGNTVVVVEHDLDTIRRADHVIDLGPGAGRHGGNLVAAGTAKQIQNIPQSLTGQFLKGERKIEVPKQRQPGNGKKLVVRKAAHNNLKEIDVEFPLATMTCVTGVSGSGKSSLVNDVLKKAVNKHLKIGHDVPGKHKKLEGGEHIDKLIVIDQSPIGRTPRSNPATYTDAFTAIRNLFAQVPEAKTRGYKPGRFSFNVKGGRCEECKGDGIKKIEMQFLPDVYVTCSVCQGKRFNNETLTIRYKGRNIADVLDMTVEEATEFFSAIPTIHRKLKTLADVGLGYIHLGQQATTLSGGEAQRVKLATELSKLSRGHTLYILDEPTTGLHVADIETLLHVLNQLRDQGNTVLIIEHNLEVIKTADHIIDLGPEGGDKGGRIVAQGTPEEVCENTKSHTGRFLQELL